MCFNDFGKINSRLYSLKREVLVELFIIGGTIVKVSRHKVLEPFFYAHGLSMVLVNINPKLT